MIRRTTATLVLLLAAASTPARAADPPDPALAVLDVHAADPSLQQSADSVRRALARSFAKYRVRVVEDHPAVLAARSQQDQAAAEAALARARAHAKEGLRLYEKQDPAASERELRAAIGLFEPNAGWLASSGDLVGAYLTLARIFFATERELAAREVFRRVVQLAPDLTLDRAVYPSALIAIHDGVRAQLVSGLLGSLSVESDPSPARVFLDGIERGVTPMEVVNIPPGIHSLKLSRPGFVTHVEPIEVVSYRVDRASTRLEPQRHPHLGSAFTPGGAKDADALGTTVAEWVGEIADRARLDLAIVGQVTRGPGGVELRVRAFGRDGGIGEVRTGRPGSLDALAEAVLLEAAGRSWIAPLAARRNVASGGGALDTSAPWAVTIALQPHARIAGASRSFPRAPGAGLRAGIDRRLLPAVVVFGATGVEAQAQSGIVLRDESGAPLPGNDEGVGAIYASVPLEAGARWYGGVGRLAPYAAASAELRLDLVSWRERLPRDRLSSNPGIGWAGSLGGGVERALDSRSAVFADARVHASRVGVTRATLRSDGHAPRSIPVDAGTAVAVRVQVGYRKVFQ